MQKNRPECWVSEMNFCRTMLAEAVFDNLLWHSIAVVIAQQVMFNRWRIQVVMVKAWVQNTVVHSRRASKNC